MDQSLKAYMLILEYDRKTGNDRWYCKILERLRRLNCCIRSKNEVSEGTHCGEGDFPLSEPPYLVDITTADPGVQNSDRNPLGCEEVAELERRKFNPSSFNELVTVAYYKSTDNGPRRVRRRRRHAFDQCSYTGDFQS